MDTTKWIIAGAMTLLTASCLPNPKTSNPNPGQDAYALLRLSQVDLKDRVSADSLDESSLEIDSKGLVNIPATLDARIDYLQVEACTEENCTEWQHYDLLTPIDFRGFPSMTVSIASCLNPAKVSPNGTQCSAPVNLTYSSRKETNIDSRPELFEQQKMLQTNKVLFVKLEQLNHNLTHCLAEPNPKLRSLQEALEGLLSFGPYRFSMGARYALADTDEKANSLALHRFASSGPTSPQLPAGHETTLNTSEISNRIKDTFVDQAKSNDWRFWKWTRKENPINNWLHNRENAAQRIRSYEAQVNTEHTKQIESVNLQNRLLKNKYSDASNSFDRAQQPGRNPSPERAVREATSIAESIPALKEKIETNNRRIDALHIEKAFLKKSLGVPLTPGEKRIVKEPRNLARIYYVTTTVILSGLILMDDLNNFLTFSRLFQLFERAFSLTESKDADAMPSCAETPNLAKQIERDYRSALQAASKSP